MKKRQKLGLATWYPCSWTKYNRTYGQRRRRSEEDRDTVCAIGQSWVDNLREPLVLEESVGDDFDQWVKKHNGLLTDLTKSTSRGNADSNEKIQKRFQLSCLELIRICDSKARHLEFLCEDKKATKYLRIQFKWRALELKKFGRYIAVHAKHHENERWM